MQNFFLIGEVARLSFGGLEQKEYSGEEVQVRGFYYETAEGRHVLASQPNLRSCCVGSRKKVSEQIALIGDLPAIPLKRAVTLQGNFSADPTYNEDDELIGLYYLKNIKLIDDIDDTKVYSLVAFFVIVFFMIVGVAVYRRRK